MNLWTTLLQLTSIMEEMRKSPQWEKKSNNKQWNYDVNITWKRRWEKKTWKYQNYLLVFNLKCPTCSDDVHFDSGEVIIKEGDLNSGAYKITEGEGEITKKSEISTSILAKLGEGGAIFGEMSLIDDKPRSAAVTAITDVKCILIEKFTFDHELAESSPVIKILLQVYSERLRGWDNRISPQVK